MNTEDEYWRARLMIECLNEYVNDARNAIKQDRSVSGVNRAAKILDGATEHIQEYYDDA